MDLWLHFLHHWLWFGQGRLRAITLIIHRIWLGWECLGSWGRHSMQMHWSRRRQLKCLFLDICRLSLRFCWIFLCWEMCQVCWAYLEAYLSEAACLWMCIKRWRRHNNRIMIKLNKLQIKKSENFWKVKEFLVILAINS